MNNQEFLTKLKSTINNHRTIYMWGVFGALVTEKLITDKSAQYPNWYTASRVAEYHAQIGKKCFGFDCVNLIKGILWGWNGDVSKANGGAVYRSNGVPDINADGMISLCKDISSDFSNIIPGEAVWIPGHIGVYIGYGKVIECTPSWNNCVQITACKNIGTIDGLNSREWRKHGKIPYVDYNTAEPLNQTTDSGLTIRVKLTGSNTIKVMDLEEYIRGVVPGEMHIWWESEALKAQAVAARSYALVKMRQNTGKDYDVDDTTKYQVYRPEKANGDTDSAVDDTRGQVLAYNGSVAETAYSASNGGKVLSAASVWGGNVPYLIEQADTYDRQEKYGHGVGMSQVGAQERALVGYDYRGILSFYYPGTVLVENYGSNPAQEQPVRTANEITIDNAIADGVLMDRALWLDILDGETTIDAERIKTALDRYHIKYVGGNISGSAELTVDNAINDGVLMDRPLWLDILNAAIPATPERVKTALDRYHNKLAGKGA